MKHIKSPGLPTIWYHCECSSGVSWNILSLHLYLYYSSFFSKNHEFHFGKISFWDFLKCSHSQLILIIIIIFVSFLKVFSAVCVGLAAAGGNHVQHTGSSLIYTSGLSGYAQQQPALVDVPYTVVGGSTGNTGRSYQYHYRSVNKPVQQQIQIQPAQLVQQATYSHPQIQSQHLVNVPYTYQTVQRSNVGSSAGVVLLPSSTVQAQASPVLHTVGVPASQGQILIGGYSGLSGSLGGSIAHPNVIGYNY